MATKTALWLTASALLVTGCGSSPLQPSISDRAPVSGDGDDVLGGAQQVGGGGGAGTSGGGSFLTSCARTTGHGVYYAGSTVSLTYTCTGSVSQLATSGMPSFLTGVAGGSAVTFTGTAPAGASQASWSFAVNGQAQSSTVAVTTQVIDSVPTASLGTNGVDLASAYGTPVSLGLAAVALDPAWDGATDDVTLSLLPGTQSGGDLPSTFSGQLFAATDSDVQNLTYEGSCQGATGIYVCPDATAAAGSDSFTGGGLLSFAYSPYDEGTYTVKFRPLLTVDGATFRLPELTQTLHVPEATYGNVTLTHSGNTSSSGTLDAMPYTYGLAIGAASTPLAPVLGYAYAAKTNGAGNALTYLSRLSLDRTVSAQSATPTGVTQASTQLLVSSDDSQLSRVVGLGDGSWALFDRETDGSGDQSIMFEHATDGSTPASSLHTAVMQPGSGDTFYSVDATAPFVDGDGTTRLAWIDLWTDGSTANYIDIGKVNPAATAGGYGAGTIEDDPNWQSLNPSSTNYFETNVTYTENIDLGVIREATSGGAQTFFFGYRHNGDIELQSVQTEKVSNNWVQAGPITLTSDITTPATVFANEAPNAGDHQSFSLAVGTPADGAQLVGVVWRESDGNTQSGGPYCWFRRIASSLDLTTRSAPLQLSQGPCRQPSIAFNPATGRFIATYGELVNGTWQISEREITTGTTDTASATMTVVSGLASYPTQLEAAFYPGGSFMGLLYRIQGTDAPKIHGFHVAGF